MEGFVVVGSSIFSEKIDSYMFDNAVDRPNNLFTVSLFFVSSWV